jgi:hypothetical protein
MSCRVCRRVLGVTGYTDASAAVKEANGYAPGETKWMRAGVPLTDHVHTVTAAMCI